MNNNFVLIIFIFTLLLLLFSCSEDPVSSHEGEIYLDGYMYDVSVRTNDPITNANFYIDGTYVAKKTSNKRDFKIWIDEKWASESIKREIKITAFGYYDQILSGWIHKPGTDLGNIPMTRKP